MDSSSIVRSADRTGAERRNDAEEGNATNSAAGLQVAQATVSTKYCGYPWFYSIYIIVLITMTILPLIGVGSFLFVYPSYIMALVMFILVGYCQKRASQREETNSQRGEQTIAGGPSVASLSSSGRRRTQEAVRGVNRMSYSYFVASRPSLSADLLRGPRRGPCPVCLDTTYTDPFNLIRNTTPPIGQPPSYGDATSDNKIYGDDDKDSIPPSYNDVMAASSEEPVSESFV